MRILFDDEAAKRLAEVARAVDGELRDEGFLRRGAVETAVEGFTGPYAGLFTTAASIESEDRGRLSGVLYRLSEQVETARTKAAEEKQRRADLAAWREREADRERRRRTEAALGVLSAGVDGFFDPKPSEYPIAPPPLSAAFSPHERRRTSDASSV
jgi:hypothetical protein